MEGKQRHYKKSKLNTSTPYDNRSNNPQPNTSKLNPTTFIQQWLSEIYPQNTRVIQHKKINKWNTPHYWNKEEKKM